MVLPIRAKNPPESTPWATYALIAINVIVFILTSDGLVIRDSVVDAWALKSNHFVPLNLLSAMFLHGDIFHLLGNMWFLLLFGQAVEGRLRSFSYVLVYMAAGLLGSFAHHFAVGLQAPDIPTLGASGAIMGVLGAALYMFPHGRITCFYWFFFKPGTFDVAMWIVAIFYLGGDFLSALFASDTGVAHLAHLGGAFGGFFVTLFFAPLRDCKEVSKVKAEYNASYELSELNTHELESVWKQRKDDPETILSWMRAHQKEGLRPREVCLNAFIGAIPNMLDECDCVIVAETSRFLTDASRSPIPGHLLVMVAERVEIVADVGLATSIYSTAIKDEGLSVPDLQKSLFKLGMLQERAGNEKGAIDFYQRVTEHEVWTPSRDDASQALSKLNLRRTG